MGVVEIIDGWDAVNAFAVMDWSASGDSGWMAATFATRKPAVAFARRYASEHGRELHNATIIPFAGRGA